MKKLFTLIALLTCFIGAKAEWVEVYKIDYSSYQGFPFYVMGYVPEWYDGVMTDLGAMYKYVTLDNEAGETSDVIVKTNGGVEYYRIPLSEPEWHQYFIADGIPTDLDGSYTIKAMVKASEPCTINVNMGWGWGDGQQTGTSVSIGTEWQEVEWEYSGIGGTSCNLVAQPGTVTATIEWKYVSVTTFKKQEKPIEWIELLTNGDAETPWADPNVAYNDESQNYLICAWGKERERNMNADDGWDPFPCDIEEEGGNHYFIVHGQPATTEGDAAAWDNQFWIQSPRAWKAGEQVKIHFRYKASKTVTVPTQTHYQTPSNYLIWHAIGDINFTEDWQEFDKVVTWEADMAGGWSVAFQLNQNDHDAINYYFDDLSWCEMKLEHGYYVAGANPQDGVDYDFDAAVKFEFDDDANCYTATIGSKEQYFSQIMISTVYGNDAAFKSATLKPAGAIENDPELWLDYTESSLAKLNLPGAGIWKIYLDDEYKAMAFEMLEGEIIEIPEINPNPTEIVINALEREYTAAEAEELGIAAPDPAGQPWDNQFWIVANRTLSAGEATIVQFKYKSSIPATVSTQCHKEPGNYLHWHAINNISFTEDWQDFSTTFTVDNEADGMQSIAFNMAEIKSACDYYIKDVVWKLEDGTQSLINQTGTENFFFKVVGGAVGQYIDPDGISEVVNNSNTTSTGTYNLAGQRVSNDYKGIVVKDGRKYINK